MADGLLNKKIAFIIQARMQSTRLPGKILMPLPFGSDAPLLGNIVQSLKTSRTNNTIIIATSTNPENDLLESFCNDHRIACFRGSEEDVLSRFIAILQGVDCEIVVRLTADNPFIDAKILDESLEKHLASSADYSFTKGLPLGMNLEIISASALKSLASKELNDPDREHVTLYLRNSGLYRLNCIESFAKEVYKPLRLTVDYPSDYLVASALFSIHIQTGIPVGIQLIEYALKNHPWIFEANRNNFQKGNYTSLADEIENVKPILEQLEFGKVLTLLASQSQNE